MSARRLPTASLLIGAGRPLDSGRSADALCNNMTSINLADLRRIPCRLSDKAPLTPHGFRDAAIDVDDSRWPLVGVVGFDVIDVDPRHGGHLWLEANKHRIPPTRMHRTRAGGWHYFFNPSGRRLKRQLAPGVDLKGATTGFVVWWPREGYAFEDHPIADWPDWLLELAVAGVGVPLDPRPVGTPTLPITPYEQNYANRALSNAAVELMNCAAGGRNVKLNALAFKMGRLVVRGWIDRGRVEQLLEWGADQCRLTADDGIASVRATMASGLRAGMERPYHEIREHGPP
jgi:hypothetical protein